MSAKVVGLSLLVLLLLFLTTRKLRIPQPVKAAEEQALIATVRLRSGDMGNAEERQRIVALEDRLTAAIKQSKAGEVDGDEFGNGVCTVYMYGPSADRLFKVALPILKKFVAPPGSYVVKRYGKPGAKQDRVALGDD
jgi:hypothetical protein